MRGMEEEFTVQDLVASFFLNPSYSELIHLEFRHKRRLGCISYMKVIICLSAEFVFLIVFFFFHAQMIVIKDVL